jgi:ketosteroid isomerase-like protein
MNRLFAFVAILFLAGCCSMSRSSDFRAGDADSAIRRVDAEFGPALGARNLDMIMSIYDADSILMPPNAPAFNGPEAIRQFWTGFVGAGKVEGTLTPDNIVQACDMAAEAGHYELTITPASGAPVRDSGKYVVTWRKRKGRWVALYDIFNSNIAK